MGSKTYPRAQELLVLADGGGSNSSRCRQWKLELQRFADDSGLIIRICHLPPGTSKWNKIEHRLFSQITENWRGRPLVSHEAIVNLIANTTTKTGLHVRAELDSGEYPTGVVVTDEQMKSLNLEPADFHGHDWNYTLRPHSNRSAPKAVICKHFAPSRNDSSGFSLGRYIGRLKVPSIIYRRL